MIAPRTTPTDLLDPALPGLRGEGQVQLHEAAGDAARENFGRKIFIRAVVEVSNFCRQNCGYCGMRRDNRGLQRFRIMHDEVRRIVHEALPEEVTDINFQTGEDPVAVREILLPLIAELRRETNLGISVCLGLLDEKLYAELRQAGASYYIMKLETGNAAHYRQMQAPGSLDKRLAAIRHLASTGWDVSSGFIHGLPHQTEDHLLETLSLLASLPLRGASVSPFIAGRDTPLADQAPADIETTLNCVAALRLLQPGWIIPAVSAMNILQPGAYVRALQAGANLTTINLTPEGWRENYLLYKRDRFIMSTRRVLDAIAAAGCEPSRESMQAFLQGARR